MEGSTYIQVLKERILKLKEEKKSLNVPEMAIKLNEYKQRNQKAIKSILSVVDNLDKNPNYSRKQIQATLRHIVGTLSTE